MTFNPHTPVSYPLVKTPQKLLFRSSVKLYYHIAFNVLHILKFHPGASAPHRVRNNNSLVLGSIPHPQAASAPSPKRCKNGIFKQFLKPTAMGGLLPAWHPTLRNGLVSVLALWRGKNKSPEDEFLVEKTTTKKDTQSHWVSIEGIALS